LEPRGSEKEIEMKNETATPQPTDTPKTKRKKETTAAGKVGDWQRLLAPLVANADDLSTWRCRVASWRRWRPRPWI
jgi:hypothetical protein